MVVAEVEFDFFNSIPHAVGRFQTLDGDAIQTQQVSTQETYFIVALNTYRLTSDVQSFTDIQLHYYWVHAGTSL